MALQANMLLIYSFFWFFMASLSQAADPDAVAAALSQPKPAAFAHCLDCEKFLHFDTSFLPSIQKRIPFINEYPVKQESCSNLIRDMSKNTDPIPWPPPNLEEIISNNKSYHDDLLMGGLATAKSWYFSSKYNGKDVAAIIWNPNSIQNKISEKCTCGQYGHNVCERVMMSYSSTYVNGKVGMIIGSENPWAEALAFRFGATQVYTEEFREIKSTFPGHVTLTPAEVTTQYLANKLPLFDFIFTYSSLEHTGLGRYGDRLDAFGDILAIARARCQLKTGGVLFLGFPVGHDSVFYNAHRFYGYYRLHLIVSLGFEVLDFYGYNIDDGETFTIHHVKRLGKIFQPVIVLKKIGN